MSFKVDEGFTVNRISDLLRFLGVEGEIVDVER
jgi:hypothetical protein